MHYKSSKFFKVLSVLLLVTHVQPGICASGEEGDGKWETFIVMKKARSGAFFYDTSVDFSKYSKVMLFPVIFDEVKISAEAKAEYVKSWEAFGEEGWKEVAGYFDASAHKIFSESDVFALEKTPGDDVIIIQSSLVDFTPHVENTDDPTGTVGHSINMSGLGNMSIQTMFLGSKGQQLLVVVKSLSSISTGGHILEDSRISRRLAWRRSFQRVADDLHRDLKKLLRKKPVRKR